MLSRVVFAVTLLISFSSFGQDVIEWDKDYRLQKSDFGLSKKGNIDSYSVYAACVIDFQFQMNGYQFMFTKNFNSKVKTTFTRSASFIQTSDSLISQRLVKLSQVEFDMAELYARKFRKLLFENKNAFSNVGFYQDLYTRIQKEHADRHSDLIENTNTGMAENRVREYQEQVLKEIDELSDYCKFCKPAKQKK